MVVSAGLPKLLAAHDSLLNNENEILLHDESPLALWDEVWQNCKTLSYLQQFVHIMIPISRKIPYMRQRLLDEHEDVSVDV